MAACIEVHGCEGARCEGDGRGGEEVQRCRGAEVQRVHRCRKCAWCGGAEGAEGADLQRVAEAAAQPRREAADEADLQRKVGTACMVRRCGGAEGHR